MVRWCTISHPYMAASAVPPASLGLIAPIARAIQARFRGLTDFAELQQRGVLVLLTAAADPERTVSSQRAYLRLRIRGAMIDSLRRELQRHEVSHDTEPAVRTPAPTMGELLLLLPPRSRAILELRIQGYTQADIGVACRISQSRVSRIEARAVRTLRLVA